MKSRRYDKQVVSIGGTCNQGQAKPENGWAPLFENLKTLEEFLELTRHQYKRQSIYKWVSQEGMPHKKIRGKLWFPPEALTWLERSS